MAPLAFSRLGWLELARAFAIGDDDLALGIRHLLAFDRSACPRWDLPHPVSRRIVAEWTRIQRERRERAWGIR